MKWRIVSQSVFVSAFLAASVSTASESSTAGVNPVTKVVGLLEDLKSKIEADTERNQDAHEKYQCWCGKVEEAKTKSISEAKALVKDLEGEIDINDKKKKATETALKKTAEKMKDAQEEYDKASKVYNQQNTALKHEIAEEHEAVESIVKAKAFLGGPVALIQQKSSAMMAAFKEVILALPAGHAAKLDSTSLELLEKAATGGPAGVTGQLTDIMQQLDNSFNSSLDELMDRKKKADAIHENETAEVRATLDLLKKETATLLGKVAEIESEVADQNELKGATEAQKKADADFLNTTSTTCLSRRKEFNSFLKQREEELAGCNKALEHLTSDKARELTLRSVPTAPSFLQLSSSDRALSALQLAATRSGSRRLSALAAQMKKALPSGGFKKVLASMDTMLKTLSDEAAADQAKKDKCQENYQKIASTVNKQTFLVRKNEAKIDVLEEKIEDFQEKQAEAENEIDENKKELASMEKLRKAEAATYASEKADDEASIKLLKETYDMLAKFYTEKPKKSSLLQGPVIPEGTSQENKDLMRSEAKYELSDRNEQKGAADMVLGMMERVIDGLKSDISSATATEDKAIAEYTAQKKELDESNKDLTDTIADLKSDITKSKGKISDSDEDKTDAQGEVDAQNKFKSQIQEECDWIISKFSMRFEKRESEAAGIKRAKDLLENTGLSFLQKRSGRHASVHGVMQPL